MYHRYRYSFYSHNAIPNILSFAIAASRAYRVEHPLWYTRAVSPSLSHEIFSCVRRSLLCDKCRGA